MSSMRVFRLAAAVYGVAGILSAQTPELLPGTTRWEFPSDIVADQYRELRNFYERQHRDAAGEREQFARLAVEDRRKRLAELTGVRDDLMTPSPATHPVGRHGRLFGCAGVLAHPAIRHARTDAWLGQYARAGYGILLAPHGGGRRPAVIMIPDATQSAADLAGLTGHRPRRSPLDWLGRDW